MDKTVTVYIICGTHHWIWMLGINWPAFNQTADHSLKVLDEMAYPYILKWPIYG